MYSDGIGDVEIYTLNCGVATNRGSLGRKAKRIALLSCQSNEGNAVTCTVRRRQFPMTPALVRVHRLSIYRSQGQTSRAVIVDIATLPTSEYLIQ